MPLRNNERGLFVEEVKALLGLEDIVPEKKDAITDDKRNELVTGVFQALDEKPVSPGHRFESLSRMVSRPDTIYSFFRDSAPKLYKQELRGEVLNQASSFFKDIGAEEDLAYLVSKPVRNAMSILEPCASTNSGLIDKVKEKFDFHWKAAQQGFELTSHHLSCSDCNKNILTEENNMLRQEIEKVRTSADSKDEKHALDKLENKNIITATIKNMQDIEGKDKKKIADLEQEKEELARSLSGAVSCINSDTPKLRAHAMQTIILTSERLAEYLEAKENEANTQDANNNLKIESHVRASNDNHLCRSADDRKPSPVDTKKHSVDEIFKVPDTVIAKYSENFIRELMNAPLASSRQSSFASGLNSFNQDCNDNNMIIEPSNSAEGRHVKRLRLSKQEDLSFSMSPVARLR